MYIYMHVCTYTHLYIHIYFTACGPPKHQRVMSGRRNHVRYVRKCKKIPLWNKCYHNVSLCSKNGVSTLKYFFIYKTIS